MHVTCNGRATHRCTCATLRLYNAAGECQPRTGRLLPMVPCPYYAAVNRLRQSGSLDCCVWPAGRVSPPLVTTTSTKTVPCRGATQQKQLEVIYAHTGCCGQTGTYGWTHAAAYNSSQLHACNQLRPQSCATLATPKTPTTWCHPTTQQAAATHIETRSRTTFQPKTSRQRHLFIHRCSNSLTAARPKKHQHTDQTNTKHKHHTLQSTGSDIHCFYILHCRDTQADLRASCKLRCCTAMQKTASRTQPAGSAVQLLTRALGITQTPGRSGLHLLLRLPLRPAPAAWRAGWPCWLA